MGNTGGGSLCALLCEAAKSLGFYEFELQKIEFSRKTGWYTVFARCGSTLRPKSYFELKRRAAELTGTKSIRFSFSYACDIGDGLSDDAYALVNEIASESDEAVKGIVRMASVKLSDGKLTLGFAQSISVAIAQTCGAAELLESFFSEFYARKIKVECYQDETIKTAPPSRKINKQSPDETHPKRDAVAPEIPPIPKEELRKEKPAVPASAPAKAPKQQPKKSADTESKLIVRGKRITMAPTPISEIIGPIKNIAITGELVLKEEKTVKNGELTIIECGIYDGTGSIYFKLFQKTAEAEAILPELVMGARYTLRGKVDHDNFLKELCFSPIDINHAEARSVRMDKATEKRVELHLHTSMSMMDAPISVEQAVGRAVSWGHDAIAITDHGVVQAFPYAERAAAAAKKKGLGDIKIIYGMEAYLIDDGAGKSADGDTLSLSDEYVVFDIETTGLNPSSETIIEIGAVRVKNGEIADGFSEFINPRRPIPMKITDLTGISDDMVREARTIDEVLPDFLAFCKSAPLVAHNASFDTGFVRRQAGLLGLSVTNRVIDTLELSRRVYRGLSNYKLDTLARHLHIRLEHHRAQNDAECCAKVFIDILHKLSDADGDMSKFKGSVRDMPTFHTILLARNKTGLRNLYELVSKSHIEYFYRRPRLPRSLVEQHREGLIIGSACEQGELFRALLRGESEERIDFLCRFYDYYEIQPRGNNFFLIREGELPSEAALDEIYFKIIALGEKYGKPVVATTDTHFLDPEDEIYRRIIFTVQKYADAAFQAPLYFRTTEEMLSEFSFLGREKAYEVVVTNTRLISDRIERFKLLPEGTAMPVIEGASDELIEMCYSRAKQIYGDPLPEIVDKRLKRELDSIVGHGFSVLYYIAQKLVKKSLSDGYLVGSRGSVGSSFAAFAAGITEVNPLPAHYVCPKCWYSDFDVDIVKYECGVDLPEKKCPVCGETLTATGYNIPFEVFLGIDADKVPDIDLNFSSEYQPQAHAYTEEIFGKEHVFRAGTISSLAEKTAYGYVKSFFNETGTQAGKVEIARLARGVTGVKRTTGQHPGGLVVVPSDMDIHDFSPVQHPANDLTSASITTHFEFSSLHDTLVKLDILGHDDPTVLKMLERLTGVDPKAVPLNDADTMSLFTSTRALGITPEDIMGCKNGAIALPEFGTKFVRGMLNDTQPGTMSELIRIAGLSHGENLWLGNAQELIKEGTAVLSTALCTRDDIMLYLVQKGMEQRKAFFIMENVRKGKKLTEDQREEMRGLDVPEWFIDSCMKIKYMFPRAHAAAYVMMAIRIAWFKVHYPAEFYATYFTVRADNFSAEYVMSGRDGIVKNMAKLASLGDQATAQQKDMITYLEVALEMYARGLSFSAIDLDRSHATEYLIEGSNLRLPFISAGGMGSTAANAIYEARRSAPFTSVEDLRKRGKVNTAVVDKLREFGCLRAISETDQLTFGAW